MAFFTVAVFFGTSEGLHPLFGQSYGAKEQDNLKFYFRTGILINFVGSVVITALIILFSRPICVLFGADPTTLEYTPVLLGVHHHGFGIYEIIVLIFAFSLQ